MIYPCASVISVFHFRPVDIAEGWWTPLLTDIFIQCCSWIYSFRVSHGCIHSVLSLCPQPSAWTQIKKRNTDITDFTRIGLSRIFFFDNIWVSDSWILLWIYLDLRVLTHSLSWRYRYCYSTYRHQPPPNLKPILTFPKGRNKLLRIQISAPT